METIIKSLGPCEIRSPLHRTGTVDVNFKTDTDRVLFDDSLESVQVAYAKGEKPVSFEMAGPRERLFFDPPHIRAGIVTCGGLCPGLNDVIRGIVMELHYRYGTTT